MEDLKIYDFTESQPDNPSSIDRPPDSLGIPLDFNKDLKIPVFESDKYVDGELIQKSFFAEFDPVTRLYSVPIVNVYFTITRNTYQFEGKDFTLEPISLDINQSYITVLENEIFIDTKTVQFADPVIIQENMRERRSNVIYKELFPQATLVGIGGLATELFSVLESEADAYISGGSAALYNAIKQIPDPRLDQTAITVTPRDFILDRVQIGIPLSERQKLIQ